MKYMNILDCSIADGEGIRVVLYVSGCVHCCKGCHNRESWDCNVGKLFTQEVKEKLFKLLARDYIDGFTLSGGDPLIEVNLKECTILCKEIKERFPNKTIWLYTGYVYENVSDLDIMNYVDVVVDGPFIQEQRDITLPFRGSSNQRIIYVKESTV